MALYGDMPGGKGGQMSREGVMSRKIQLYEKLPPFIIQCPEVKRQTTLIFIEFWFNETKDLIVWFDRL